MQAMKASWVCGLAILGLAGCQAQADSDYQGEPLLTVSGKVVTGETVPTEAMDVAVLWAPRDTGSSIQNASSTIARAQVTGSFPSAFTLNVFDPPPGSDDPAYDSQTAWGLVVAVPSDSPTSTETPEVLGGAIGVRVVYFQEDGNPNEPDSEVNQNAKLINVEPTKGFHVARAVLDGEQAEGDWYRCWAPNGLCVRYHEGLEFESYNDEEFARCLKYVPDATTCNIYHTATMTAAEDAETTTCRDLVMAQEQAAAANAANGKYCVLPYHWESLDRKDSTPLTVTLGIGMIQIIDVHLPL